MKRRVVITGIGVIAPTGLGTENFWGAVTSGKSGIGEITRFDTSSYPCRIAGEINDFDPTDYMSPKMARRMDRFSQLAVACSQEAMEDAGLRIDDTNRDRIGISLGSALAGVSYEEQQHSIFLEKGLRRVDPLLATRIFLGEAASHVSIALGIRGHSNSIGGACSAGADAVGYAFHCIANGLADVMLAGASEAPLGPLTFGAFGILGVLSRRNGSPSSASRPFDATRDGFVMAEGAAAMLLEELGHASKRDARIYAEIVGYGTTFDAFHMVQPSPSGEAGRIAVEKAIKESGLRPEELDYISAHGTSTVLNDKVETQIIKKVFKAHAYRIPVNSVKSMIGHTLGAAGAIEVAICALSIRDQFVHPTINLEHPDPECDLDYVPLVGKLHEINVALSNSFGFGGKNSAFILRKPDDH